ncbi:thiol:disulfide interchange protein DsbD [Roseateles sp. YR242]|uniref:protein-disulfide reductase DsbD family protein n=1 Tax=Roseateles sp. YR242 TaxID=1855305 RepID=UPI0008B62DA2|nr:protein-disulfide reductase DsbD domain-containing protein [Roseateles sp. YR242]SEK86353.1 thiol:disulfide interchange protein DsbD [Roseateles sp. YR242]
MRSLLIPVALALVMPASLMAAQATSSPASPSASSTSASSAVDRASTDEVSVRLLTASRTVQPGQTLLLGLEQRISPHWHTYWRNPGDSGQPTSISWDLPAGAQASDIHWPAPQRFDVGPITNYGYENQTLLLTEVKLPASLTPGQTIQLKADATWLVCREECIPQQATLTLHLPVAAQAAASEDNTRLSAAKAALPAAAPFPVVAALQGKELIVQWPAAAGGANPTADKTLFLPQDWGRIQHAARPQLDQADGQWRLRMPVGEQPAQAGQTLEGLLLVGDRSWAVRTQVGGVGTADGPGRVEAGVPAPAVDGLSLGAALGLALVGGLILNLMPCVFPVLAIKALSFLHGKPAEHRRQGLAYTAGVLVAFGGLAAVLLVLRGAGASVGWGFQFHSPLFVLLLAWLMFVLGLSLAGLLELGAGITGLGQGLASRGGLAGSFLTGVLATVVATPCTAPFMGAAMAYALAQPAAQLVLVFMALGIGLALPYLALAFWPALQRCMPRPGRWMEVLKQGLAFPMFGAAIWLVWVVAQQAGPQGVLLALSGMGLIALAIWLRSVSRPAASVGRWTGSVAAAASVAAALALLPLMPDDASTSTPDAAQASAHGYEPYSPERLAELRAQGKPVFVNLTASWCITCLVNERVALSTAEVKDAFQAKGVIYLKGDWTRQDPRITELLTRHGRSGVPLYLYFPAGGGAGADDGAQVLPQILTPGIVTSALQGSAT